MKTELSCGDTIHFGKYKGRTVLQLLVEDAGYACWLREEKRKDDTREKTFDYQVNCLIDIEIGKSKSLSKKYKPWSLPSPDIEIAAAEETAAVKAKDVAYAGGWGEW